VRSTVNRRQEPVLSYARWVIVRKRTVRLMSLPLRPQLAGGRAHVATCGASDLPRLIAVERRLLFFDESVHALITVTR
jgi:hypothetical protein